MVHNQTVRKMEILGDNETSPILSKNLESQNHTKHIDVMYHHIWELVDDRKLEIEWIQSLSILANRLIIALLVGPFIKHQEQ